MWPIVTDRVAWSVCLSVYHTSEPCKNVCTDRDAVYVEDSGEPKSPRNHELDGGPAVLRDVAMATNFGTNIAINCLCMKDSD